MLSTSNSRQRLKYPLSKGSTDSESSFEIALARTREFAVQRCQTPMFGVPSMIRLVDYHHHGLSFLAPLAFGLAVTQERGALMIGQGYK